MSVCVCFLWSYTKACSVTQTQKVRQTATDMTKHCSLGLPSSWLHTTQCKQRRKNTLTKIQRKQKWRWEPRAQAYSRWRRVQWMREMEDIFSKVRKKREERNERETGRESSCTNWADTYKREQWKDTEKMPQVVLWKQHWKASKPQHIKHSLGKQRACLSCNHE